MTWAELGGRSVEGGGGGCGCCNAECEEGQAYADGRGSRGHKGSGDSQLAAWQKVRPVRQARVKKAEAAATKAQAAAGVAAKASQTADAAEGKAKAKADDLEAKERTARKAEESGQFAVVIGCVAQLNQMMALGADQKGFRSHSSHHYRR